MKMLPKARNKDVLVQAAGDELLIYDLLGNKALALNKTVTIIYQACDGTTSYDEIKANRNYTDEIINLTLDQLYNVNLLEDSPDSQTLFGNLSRREVIRKAGLASLTALPVILSVTAPKAANAASCATTTCTFDDYKQSNCCGSNQRCNSGETCQACTPSGRPPFDTCYTGDGCCRSSPFKEICCFRFDLAEGGGVPGFPDARYCYCR